MRADSALGFLEGASERLISLMQALSVAESLTDDVARRVLEARGMPESRMDAFLGVLHCANCVVPRNSEWHFPADVRTALQQRAREEGFSLESIHALLLDIGRTADPASAGERIPAYLFTRAGVAYHTAALGHTAEALQQYGFVANASDNGELWLAGTLAQEQQRAGTIPEDAVEPAFLHALSAYRDRDEDHAYPELLRLARSDKSHEMVAWAMQLSGQIEMRRGDLNAALAHLNQAVDLFEELNSWSKCVWALGARAELWRKLGRPEDALSDLRYAISLSWGDWRARLLCRVAGIEQELNRFDEAFTTLGEAQECAERMLSSVLIQRAGLERERNMPLAALTDLDRATEVSPESWRSSALNTRASVYWELGRWEEALRDLDHAMKVARPGSQAVILNTRSCVKRDIGDFSGALADDLAILKLPPILRQTMKMHQVNNRIKKMRTALTYLAQDETGEKLDRFWFKHFFSLAQSAAKSRAWYRAIALLKRALEYAHTDPERVKCLRGIGTAYEKTRDDKTLALEPLRQAIELAPDDSIALATLGRVLDVLGSEIDEVEPYFKQAIAADPCNFWALSWYALALSKAARHAEAIAAAKAAVDGDRPHAVLLFNLATVLDASPNPADQVLALESARQAAELATPGFDAPMHFLDQRQHLAG